MVINSVTASTLSPPRCHLNPFVYKHQCQCWVLRHWEEPQGIRGRGSQAEGWLTVWLVTWYWELKGEIDCSFIKLSVSSLAPARPPSKPSEGINYQFISQLGFLCVHSPALRRAIISILHDITETLNISNDNLIVGKTVKGSNAFACGQWE